MANEVFLGTELKLNISVDTIDTYTMDDYEFEVELFCSQKRIITQNKDKLIRIDSNNYVILADSAELGAGELKCKFKAFIPDPDFEDKIRTEICAISTGINIIKNI